MREAEEVVRHWYDARARGDLDEAAELLAPDVVWHIAGRSPLAGEHRGRESVNEVLRTLRERTGGTHHAELVDVVAGTSAVVVLVRVTARRGDRLLDSRQALEVRVENGVIVELRSYIDDLYAVDAFWS